MTNKINYQVVKYVQYVLAIVESMLLLIAIITNAHIYIIGLLTSMIIAGIINPKWFTNKRRASIIINSIVFIGGVITTTCVFFSSVAYTFSFGGNVLTAAMILMLLIIAVIRVANVKQIALFD